MACWMGYPHNITFRRDEFNCGYWTLQLTWCLNGKECLMILHKLEMSTKELFLLCAPSLYAYNWNFGSFLLKMNQRKMNEKQWTCLSTRSSVFFSLNFILLLVEHHLTYLDIKHCAFLPSDTHTKIFIFV